jgi:hypothetical protein
VSAEPVSLTGASRVAGAACSHAELRPLTPEDALPLFEELDSAAPARAVTAVLAHCLVRLGDVTQVEPDHVRDLTLGDREALMLRVRRAAVGERLECSAFCDCGERLELAVEVGDLLLAPYAAPAERHALEGGGRTVRFRLPNGADAEAAADVALAAGSEVAVELLLRRCAEPGCDPGLLSAELAALDPQADVELGAVCPDCGAELTVPLDASGWVLAELRRIAAALVDEVHLLATSYGWSEAEIVALGTRRRRRYIDRLDGAAEAAWATS